MIHFTELSFYFLLFTIPLNLGKHFFLNNSQSYVNGILVDYLVPILYLSDIAILVFSFLILKILLYRRQKTQLRDYLLRLLPFAIFILLLVPSIFEASNKAAALYKLFRYVELSIFSVFFVSFVKKLNFTRVLNVSCILVLFQSFLVLCQWFKQGSLFGYFPFGESQLIASPPFALANFFGVTVLRPYGSFPHPNVLGGFLTIVLTFIFGKFLLEKSRSNLQTLLIAATLFFGSISVLLSFSRSSILVLLGGYASLLLVKIYKSTKLKFLTTTIFVTILFAFVSLAFLWILNTNPLSIVRRVELSNAAAKMFVKSPIFGVGLNNFVVHLEDYTFVTGVSRFIQPVHNVFLLVLAESGIVGLLGFLVLLVPSLINSFRSRNTTLLVVLLQIMVLGFFDHYFITIQQTLIMFLVVLGASLSKNLRQIDTV